MSFPVARWHEADALFEQALALAPSDRPAFIAARCGGDAGLRRQIEALVAMVGEVDGLLEAPLRYTALLEDGGGPVPLDVLPEAARQVGPYRLLHPIGQGGMGTVYLAERADGQFAQRVAVKRLRTDFSAGALHERFRLERQILAQLEHPGITRLIDGGVDAVGAPYLVMEYVEGVPVDRYCDVHRLGLDARLQLFLQVCEAVQYAHRNLVVHRDLKPGNILVTGAGQVKLLDFGIAKLLGEAERAALPATLTAAGGQLLTPEYAAPEQVRGEAVTTATDVYALGIILFELLAGRRPYRVTSRLEMARVICEEPVRAPSLALTEAAADGQTAGAAAHARATTTERLRRRLAGDLDTIVLTALRKEPDRRYPSVDALVEDVRRYRSGLPVLARKDTVTYRLGKFVRRHRAAVVVSSLLVLSLVGGMLATAYQAREARAQAVRAQQETEKAERINVFLQEMLSAPDPAALGRDATVLDVLDTAIVLVDRQLAEEPEVAATVYTTIGMVYQKLGRSDGRVEEILKKGLALRRAALGPDHALVGESLDRLAAYYRSVGDQVRSERLFREALAVRRKATGDESLDVSQALNNLSSVLYAKGDYAGAEQHLRAALAIRLKLLGEEDVKVAMTQMNLAMLLKQQDKLEEAEALARAVLAKRRRLQGEAHPDVAYTLDVLGGVLNEAGRYAEAERFYSEALAMRRRLLGDDHPLVAVTVSNLATIHIKTGAAGPAVQLTREALALTRKAVGERHPSTGKALSNLGAALMERGDYEEAESVHRQALVVRRAVLRAGHPDVATTLGHLAWLAQQRRAYGEAEALLQEALAVEREQAPDGAPHSDVALVLDRLAWLRAAQGRAAAAEPLFRQALGMYRQTLRAGHPRTATTLLGLGTVLTAEGRPHEAEPLLREALAIQRKAYPATHWRVAEVESVLGAGLAAVGRNTEAETLLLQSLTALGGSTHPRAGDAWRETRVRLADLYTAWGRPDHAALYRREAGTAP